MSETKMSDSGWESSVSKKVQAVALDGAASGDDAITLLTKIIKILSVEIDKSNIEIARLKAKKQA